MTEQELKEIEERAAKGFDDEYQTVETDKILDRDIPRLVAEVRRLQEMAADYKRLQDLCREQEQHGTAYANQVGEENARLREALGSLECEIGREFGKPCPTTRRACFGPTKAIWSTSSWNNHFSISMKRTSAFSTTVLPS